MRRTEKEMQWLRGEYVTLLVGRVGKGAAAGAIGETSYPARVKNDRVYVGGLDLGGGCALGWDGGVGIFSRPH